ncbi:MAG: AAA family ATPase [Desulfurococcales archaeon]|jgi:cytidylate kinase|nr:AAA family ATPase [Desulfurococcales archaeon]
MRDRGLVIAISGPPGSGKSTLASALAKELGLRHHSTGAIFRRIASDRGVSVEELDRIAESDPSIDLMIDSIAKREAMKGGVVVEGHIATWMVKEYADLLVYVTAPIEIRAARVAARDGISLEEARRRIEAREGSMRRRFKALYSIDINDLNIHDIVINTWRISVDAMVRIVLTVITEIMRIRNDRIFSSTSLQDR